ncbi:hypothetical protein [Pedobacter punctiformis]|uniref:Uncharacterized protein n=1 Tax=Pedobacter punctiformis TaxID=3004097 RepID=A0ABT4LDW5_9SPHI|nr:hypothetical protein [Pedobacter sp. HCMS5-2]MCZ4245373.1 hypothetical protein [Pedobacter sp. HCMS5-2]
MKKVIVMMFVALTTLTTMSLMYANQTNVAKTSQKVSVLLGTVDTSVDVIQLYGDSSTGIVEYVQIVSSEWDDHVVSIMNVKVSNGIATGKIYMEDDNGSQRIIVLMNLPVY